MSFEAALNKRNPHTQIFQLSFQESSLKEIRLGTRQMVPLMPYMMGPNLILRRELREP